MLHSRNFKLIVCLGFFALVALVGCGQQVRESAVTAPVVHGDRVAFPAGGAALTVLPVIRGPRQGLRLTGRLVWNEEATVRIFSPITGRVARLCANLGQGVTKGQVLADIESPDLGQAQSDAVRATTDLRAAERNLSRLQALLEHGAAPKKDFENAESDLARAQAEQQRTQTRLTLYGGGKGVDQRFGLRSPIAGVVVDRTMNPGQEVRPDAQTALCVISDPSRLWVLLDATEQTLPLIHRGMNLKIHSAAWPAETFPGTLDIVGDTLDSTTRTLKARGSLANPGHRLKAEMYVEVELCNGDPGNAVFIPAAAAVSEGNVSYVFVAEGQGAYRRQTVRLGPEQGGRTEVLEGLKEGQSVVTEGSLLLQQLLAGKR